MPDRRSRQRRDNPVLGPRIEELLDAAGATGDRGELFDIVLTAVNLARDHADPLDLKITSAALREMREAFRIFAPYQDIPKVTVFGSARTKPDDPLYAQASAIAEALAEQGWMIVTGAGPGLMAAASEGAGRARSLGVSISLPFEQGANSVIAHDDKLVAMKYFFTRKLMLIKESRGFVCLPGGFGTLDETFELLTLTQTGKGLPVPIVMLDVPGGTYWERAQTFITDELVTRGFVNPDDLGLYLVTDNVDRAAHEITSFYANFDSLRYVGNVLVIRLQSVPDAAALEDLNDRFGYLLESGAIEVTEPLPEELTSRDKIECPRIKLRLARRYSGRLRPLIDALNALVPEPAVLPDTPLATERQP